MFAHLRIAARQLAQQPGFALTAVATLALCLGVNLTMFAVVDGVLVRALPYPEPDRLVTIYHSYPRAGAVRDRSSLRTFFERRGALAAVESLGAIDQTTTIMGDAGETHIEPLGRVTPEFFATLGVAPVLGRPFREDELTYQTDHVAIVSHETWQDRYGGDPGVIGRAVRIDGIPRTIVGVLPPGFRFLSFTAPVYMPLSSEEAERNLAARHRNTLVQVARLRPGATVADVQAQLDVHESAHASEFPQARVVAEAGYRAIVAPLHADHVASVRPMLVGLQAGALLLLVIGAVNLVNLLLVRASGRTHEIAIRRAIGATRRHLVWSALAETLLLALAGGALGLFVAEAGVHAVATLGVDRLPLGARIALDARTEALGAAAAVIAGVLLGLPTLWYHLRHGGQSALQAPRGSTAARSTHRMRAAFIVAQVALAFVLLTAAGLLGRSLQRAAQVTPGVRADHVITARFNLPWQGYHDLPSFQRFFARLREDVGRLPGVVATGAASNVPLSGTDNGGALYVPGYLRAEGESVVSHPQVGVAGDYFAAMGVPLRAGRFLDASDEDGDALRCVVDEAFARRYWPGQSAVGKTFFRDVAPEPGDDPFTIVGVVGAVKHDRLTEPDRTGTIYFPYTRVFLRNYFVVARTSVPPESLVPALARTVRGLDPEIPLTDVRSMDVRVQDSLVERRSPALLAVLFGATALLLASLGLYGVMAHSVAQRTREFGIRMALGARRSQVLAIVFGQGARLTLLGLALGLAAAVALADALSASLYGVTPRDPIALAGVAVLFGGVATVASGLPARRATRVDPIEALRRE